MKEILNILDGFEVNDNINGPNQTHLHIHPWPTIKIINIITEARE